MGKELADDDELKCSITGQFFCEPVIVPDCAHVFEQEALVRWQASQKKAAEDKALDAGLPVKHDDTLAACPLCKQKIRHFELEGEIVKRVDERLEGDPDLIYDQYVPASRRLVLNQLKAFIRAGKSDDAIQLLQAHVMPYLQYAKIDESTGRTALHEFAARGNVKGVQALMELGTSLEQTDNEGDTALDLAKRFGFQACKDALTKPFDPINQDNTMLRLRKMKLGIEAYLQWRQDHARGSRTERLLRLEPGHWYHGLSGIVRAVRLSNLIDALDIKWDVAFYRRFEHIYKRSIAESSHTEHSLASFIDRQFEPSDENMAQLVSIREGIEGYLQWSRLNTQGIRGITRFSNLYHGQSGVARAEDLLARIDLVNQDCNQYNYRQFEKAYQRAMAQSSHTEFSLARHIENALAVGGQQNQY